ncbi:hypothetical protein Ancab_035056 [Ancistrocladus abbreviatus]
MESENLMDFDLNQQPQENSLDEWLVEIEDYHERIEERIRQLEEVTARARERYSLRNSRIFSEPESVPISSTAHSEERDNGRDLSGGGGSTSGGIIGTTQGEAIFRSGKRCLGTQLIAKALAFDTPIEQKLPSEEEGGYFDCNVCLVVAKDPILTCCGHLFCWPCFYQLPFVNSNLTVRECPACKGEVSDQAIIPIYGNGNGENSIKMKSVESGFKIPPRPPAQRIESVRQQRIRRGLRHVPTEERIRQMRNRVRATMQVITETVTTLSNQVPVTDDADSPYSRLPGLFSGVLANARSLQATLSVGSDSTERFGDNMGSYRQEQGTEIGVPSLSLVLVGDANTSQSNVAVVQSENPNLDTGAGINPIMPSAGQNSASASAPVQLEAQTADVVDDRTDPMMPYVLSSSRRRTSNDGDAANERRRRRLAE